jgi:hypothetical protein
MTATSTLATNLVRVETLLMDTTLLVWDVATLTESIRLALADVNISFLLSKTVLAPLTISDLDAALTTTLDDKYTALLVRGAAGYAARSRAADRGEMSNLAQSVPSSLVEWSRLQLANYATDLFKIQADLRLVALQTATTKPHSPLLWEEPKKW